MKRACILLALFSLAFSASWRTNDLSRDEITALCGENRDAKTFAAGTNEAVIVNSTSVHWGYFWQHSKPIAVAQSGDEMYVETATHHGGDDYAAMVAGDPAMESIYKWDSPEEMNVKVRGHTGKSDGAHVMTGPIWICGAEEGDVLQIDLIELEPRKNPSTGKSFASNAASWWGFHRRSGDGNGGFATGDDPRETVTIYEALVDEDKDAGGNYYMTPRYTYQWWTDAGADNNDNGAGNDLLNDWISGQNSTAFNGAARTPCVPQNVTIEGIDGNTYMTPYNPEREYGRGSVYECMDVDGRSVHSWNEMGYRGMYVNQNTSMGPVPERVEYSTDNSFRIPAKIHPGNIGVAQKGADPTNSIPPGIWGGNFDNRRLNQGTSLFVQVQVEGAKFSMGDAHLSQGDSELDGTASEVSINAKLRFTLHKKNGDEANLPKIVQNMKTPIIETPSHFIMQGATSMNYLEEAAPFSVFGAGDGGGGDLNQAMRTTYKAARDWMMSTFDWSEDLAITAITMGVDFGVSQVVNGNWGMHALVPKMFFPVDGHPMGPRDRLGEPLAKSGLKNTVTILISGVDLDASDLEAMEGSTKYRTFVQKLEADMLAKYPNAKLTVTVDNVAMSESKKRKLLDSTVDVQMTVVGATKEQIETFISESGYEVESSSVEESTATKDCNSAGAVRMGLGAIAGALALGALALV